jgi:hypothetical protein
MSDVARIAMLTELARKAWPDHSRVQVEHFPGRFALVNADGVIGLLAEIAQHPRALDALEAMLRVLADEPPPSTLDQMRELVLAHDYGAGKP